MYTFPPKMTCMIVDLNDYFTLKILFPVTVSQLLCLLMFSHFYLCPLNPVPNLLKNVL